MDRRTVLTSIGATLALNSVARAAEPASAGRKDLIAVLGTGHLGQMLAKSWARAGYRIIFGSRAPETDKARQIARDTGPGVTVSSNKEAASAADIILFAVPSKGLDELMSAIGTVSAGKILVDPMNQMKFSSGYPVAPDDPVSTTEKLQRWAPEAKVVKAFNTPGLPNMIDPGRAGGHVSIPVAGTDVSAKNRVMSLVTELGLEPLDVGPLVAARDLEAMMRVSFGYYLYTKGKASFEFYLHPVTR